MYTTKKIYCGIIFINEVQSSGAAKFFLVPGDVISLVASSDLNISFNKYYTNAWIYICGDVNSDKGYPQKPWTLVLH